MIRTILILFLLTANVALAAGIQVAPEKLEFELTNNQTQTKYLTIANPTADVQLFEIYPDNFAKSITISPESFTLEAGERKTVQVTVDGNKLSALTTTNLSLIAKPLSESRVTINTGVKIPITIKIGESKNPNLYLVVIVIITLVGYKLWIHKREDKPPLDFR